MGWSEIGERANPRILDEWKLVAVGGDGRKLRDGVGERMCHAFTFAAVHSRPYYLNRSGRPVKSFALGSGAIIRWPVSGGMARVQTHIT